VLLSLFFLAMQPSPPVGALEPVIGDEESLDGSLEPAQADFEVCMSSSFIEHHFRVRGVETKATVL
jgi:hypothetical protein